jgi:hypothetical protein
MYWSGEQNYIIKCGIVELEKRFAEINSAKSDKEMKFFHQAK